MGIGPLVVASIGLFRVPGNKARQVFVRPHESNLPEVKIVVPNNADHSAKSASVSVSNKGDVVKMQCHKNDVKAPEIFPSSSEILWSCIESKLGYYVNNGALELVVYVPSTGEIRYRLYNRAEDGGWQWVLDDSGFLKVSSKQSSKY